MAMILPGRGMGASRCASASGTAPAATLASRRASFPSAPQRAIRSIMSRARSPRGTRRSPSTTAPSSFEPVSWAPARRRKVASFMAAPLSNLAETGADLADEQLRLLPGGEVAAAIQLAPVDDVAHHPVGPAARAPEDLLGIDAHAHRHVELDRPHAAETLPVEPGRRSPCS